MTFIEYLRTLKQPETPVGDFIGDSLGDKAFPEVVRSEGHLAGYLATKGASTEAQQAGKRVWLRYEKHCANLASAA
jgi:hypothetical protein